MKKFLIEAPVSEYLDDESKSSIIRGMEEKYKESKSGLDKSFNTLIGYLPELEYSYKPQLLDIAIKLFLYKFPDIKADIDSGDLTLDVNFIRGSEDMMTLRTSKQEPKQGSVEKAESKDEKFKERVKSRHFNNSLTQGSAWKGFNDYKQVENLLNQLDPNLVNYYQQFEKGANVYYKENESSLKNMAKNSTNRVAWTDVLKRPDGGFTLLVRAPNFPLLMHELNKGGNYYNSLRFTSEDDDVHDALVHITDTHKNEIDNMMFGNIITEKIQKIWNEYVTGYQPWMDTAIMNQYFNYSQENPEAYNEMMYGSLDEKSKNYYKNLNNLITITKEYVKDIADYYKSHPKKFDVKSEENEMNYKRAIRDGDNLSYRRNYKEAINKYREAISFKETPEAIFKITVAQGDLSMSNKDYETALSKFKYALTIQQDDDVEEKIEEVENLLNPEEESQTDLDWGDDDDIF